MKNGLTINEGQDCLVIVARFLKKSSYVLSYNLFSSWMIVLFFLYYFMILWVLFSA